MLATDMNNLWSAYNAQNDFRVLVVAESHDKAMDIAIDYAKNTSMEGDWEIAPTDKLKDVHYDCDYILTSNDNTVKTSNRLPMLSKVNQNNQAEFIGQIIDIFESFLDKRGIVIANPERDEDPDVVPEEAANIYGSDYGEIQTELENMFTKWDMTNQKLEPISEEYEYNKFGFARTRAIRYRCPVCNDILNAGPNYVPNNCSSCGQLIEFKNIEWKAEQFLGYASVVPDSPYTDKEA